MIREFWTFATDVALTLVSWGFAWKLSQRTQLAPSKTSNKTSKLWIGVFITIGFAAIQGALYHGFQDFLSDTIYWLLEVGTLWALSLTAYFIGLALLTFGLPPRHTLYKFIQGLLLIKAIIFLVVAVIHTEFLMAILDYGSSFLIAFAVHLKKIRHPASPYILGGVFVSLTAAAIQMLRISVSPSFNHNDLYHVVQLFGLYLFYRGAMRVSDAV